MGTKTKPRYMTEQIPAILLIVGGIIILVGVGLGLYIRSRPPLPDPDLAEQFMLEIPLMEHIQADRIYGPTLSPDPIPAHPSVLAPGSMTIPIPIPDPFVIDGTLFDSGNEIGLIFFVPDGGIKIPQFTVDHWEPGIFDDPNYFKPGDKSVVSFMDEARRVGLWLHSGGYGTTMYPLQFWLENQIAVKQLSPSENEQKLSDLIGTNVDISVGDYDVGFMQVVAAVRVPPDEVETLAGHAMDMIPYIAETYPDAGFSNLVDKQQVVYLYFCGLALAGEEPNPDANKWTQARFVIALTSAWEGRALLNRQ